MRRQGVDGYAIKYTDGVNFQGRIQRTEVDKHIESNRVEIKNLEQTQKREMAASVALLCSKSKFSQN